MTDPKVTLAGEKSLRPCVGYVVMVAGIGLVPPKRWLNQKLGRPLGRASSQSRRMVNPPGPMPTYWLHEGKTTMSLLADEADFIIGVDTQRDTNTAAVVDAKTGAALGDMQCATDALGYKRVLAFANRYSSTRRVWAIE
jgi:hypothetical protein